MGSSSYTIFSTLALIFTVLYATRAYLKLKAPAVSLAYIRARGRRLP